MLPSAVVREKNDESVLKDEGKNMFWSMLTLDLELELTHLAWFHQIQLILIRFAQLL
jgi:hypothetical protein